MDEKRWSRVQEVFQRACELRGEPRQVYVTGECGEDIDLAKEVESLLFYHDRSDTFLKSSAVNQALDVIQQKSESPPSLPEMIGSYEIQHVIEHGGMGSVYVAKQTEPVERFVALKVMHVGMNHDEFLTRFQYEHQALALMNHPNIAHVYDAGRTADGRPFFTMEYITGLPITEHCKRNKLTIEERLKLFLQVCEGVQHAHRKGLIHRDLKPSNILISLETRRPVPKIIDFGIAKALNPGTGHKTRAGTILGTPAYMSPEQASYQDVDTASDVYSLGMILYELLVGVLPFNDDVYEKPSPLEVLEIIRHEDPPRPSLRLLELEDKVGLTAELRKTEPQTLIKKMKGDLDWLVLKALEKNRGVRYGSVAELGADIQRYLEGAPVHASPAGTVYVFKKYVRRNKARVLFAAALFLGLVTALTGLSVGLYQANKARKQAKLEAERAKRHSDMLIRVTGHINPYKDKNNRKSLDLMSASLDSEEHPTQATAYLRNALGFAYLGLSAHEDAVDAFKKALILGNKLFSPDHRLVLESKRLLAYTYMEMGYFDKAESLSREILEVIETSQEKDERGYANTLMVLADTLKGKSEFERALEFYKKALAILITFPDEDDPDLLTLYGNMGGLLLSMGKLKEAEGVLKETHLKRARVFGEESPRYLTSMHLLARLNFLLGRYEEAERLGRTAYSLRRNIFGLDDPRTLATENNLALTLMRLGKTRESLNRRENVFDRRVRVFGEDDTNTLQALNNLADGYLEAGLLEEAERAKKKEYEILENIGLVHDPKFLFFRVTLGQVYMEQGRLDDAECLLRDIYVDLLQQHSLDYPNVAIAGAILGECLVLQSKYVEAEEILVLCWSKLRRARHEHQDQALQNLFLCYDQWGQVERSEKLVDELTKLDNAIDSDEFMSSYLEGLR